MPSKIRDNYITTLLILLVLLLCAIFIVSSPVAAQGEQLSIDVVDEVYENEDFFVSVYIINDSGIPTFLIGVELVFNGDLYYITDQGSGVATIQAPQVDEDTAYTITATKDVYTPAEKNITVLNKLPKLIVTLDKYTVNVNEKFSVVVKDENENPIANATVVIQDIFGEGAIATTNSGGRAWLVAPEVGGEITIMAQKDGYVEGTTPLMVNIGLGFWESLLQSPYTPIFIAIILLIFAIVFVNLRQKKSIDARTREISKEQALKRYGAHGKIVSLPFSEKTGKPVDRYGPRGPKIEEIRISRPRKDKKIDQMARDSKLISDFYELKVEQLMDKRVWDLPLIKKTDDVHHVLSILGGRNHIWVVKDKESKELVGVITEHDVLSILTPKHFPSYVLGMPDIRSIRHGTAKTAEEVMCHRIVDCRPDDKIIDALMKMVKHKLRRLPVVEDKKIIGELTLHQLIRKYYGATQYHPMVEDGEG